MRSRHICPECGGREFYVVVHVTQRWKVDEDGNFIEVDPDYENPYDGPSDDAAWVCAECGADGEIDEEE